MKRNLLYSSLLLAALMISTSLFAQDWENKMKDPTTNFFETQNLFYKYVDTYKANYRKANGKEAPRVPGYKQFKRWEWFMAPRVDANGKRFNPSKVWQESELYHQQYKNMNAGNWTFIGPSTVPAGGGAGRLNFIRVDPNNANTYYVGSPSGGLWKSTDAGITWSSNTDKLAQVIGCTDIAIDPTNSNTLYLATGDGDAGDTYTIGVLKSIDGGVTWNTTGLSYYMANYRQISKILIDPNNTNTIIVASTGGVFRSTDGAATFTMVQAGAFKDMEFKPGDPNVVYVCGAEFYRSTDNGQTWTKITSGLPAAANVSRMAIAVTAADANYVYMIVGLPQPNYGTEGFYKSTNSGVSWTNPSTPGLGTQQWYDLAIAADPTNKDEVLLGGQTDFLRTLNGGTTWAQNGGNTHVDYHDVIYTGTNSYIMTCDGGIYRTTNSGVTWTNLSNGLQISQMYGFGQSATNPNLLLQGWQDNGTNRFNGTNWAEVLGGDGMLCFIDRTNDQNMWGSTQNGGLNRSTNGGSSFFGATTGINETGGWVTPWLQDPVNAGIIYAGFVNMWKSTNGGLGWTKISTFSNTGTLNTIAVSPANNQVIWCAKAGGFYMTSNGGTSWTTLTNVPSGTITGIACSNTDANKAWITYSGFSNVNKVLQTNDMGVTWVNISSSVPNIPVNCITYVDNSNDALYIGTDVGIFYKDASLTVWQPFFNGLPNVVVTQMEIFGPTNKIRASTYGRGIWESDLYVPGTYAPTAAFGSDKNIACPGTAIQFTDFSAGQPTGWSWSFPGGFPSSSTQQNPLVYFNVPGTFPVTLTATNANGTDSVTTVNFVSISTSPFPAPTTVNGVRCGAGPVNLSATGTGQGTLRWWDAPGSGTLLTTGNNYTANITATTPYFVDEEFPAGAIDFVGPNNFAIGNGAYFTANDIRGLYFDILSPIIVNTVDVFPNSAGDRTIEVLDAQGNTIIDTTIFMPASPTNPLTVTVNFTLYPGNNYFIKCRGFVDLFRNTSGAVYPYPATSMNITGSNAGSPGYYYFFYNWTFTDITCNTSRAIVWATDTCQVIGIDDVDGGQQLEVYPNPSSGEFSVKFFAKQTGNYNLKITNTHGQVIYEEKLNAFSGKFQKKLDIGKFGKGAYMLSISSDGNETIRKLMVH